MVVVSPALAVTLRAPVLLLLAALAGCGLGPGRCVLEKTAELPAQYEQGAVLVPARINGIPVRMEVDTGAMTTLIAGTVAAELRLPPDPGRAMHLQGTGGTIITRNALVRSVEWGGLRSGPRSLPTGPLARHFTGGVPVAGLIGASDLGMYDLELDLRNGLMTLWSVSGCGGAFLPWTEPFHVIPLTIGFGGLAYADVTVNGHTMRAMIDWGARGSQLTLAAARRIGVTEAVLASDPAGVGHGIDGTAIALRLHRFDDVRVGTESFRGLRISVGDLRLRGADMLLGLDYARSRRVCLSYASRQMFVAPRKPPAGRFLTPGGGRAALSGTGGNAAPEENAP